MKRGVACVVLVRKGGQERCVSCQVTILCLKERKARLVSKKNQEARRFSSARAHRMKNCECKGVVVGGGWVGNGVAGGKGQGKAT